MNGKRENWVDDVKTFACILVVLGHFYQSMVKSSIVPDSSFYGWFIDTIYLFHVQLFFFCSGYLYQKYSEVRSVKAWCTNIWKKLVVLGVPYLVFTFATWLLKKLFEGSVNNKAGSIVDSLFVEPIAPYWYLYVLFFLFVLTITMRKKTEAYVLLIIALVFKALPFFGLKTGIYLVGKIMADWIWFALGMAVAVGAVKICKMYLGVLTGVLFVAVSIVCHIYGKHTLAIDFILGLLAVLAVISIATGIDEKREQPVFKYLSKYTMPVFLMHTLFAAPVRSVLLKLGVKNAIIHVVVGLIISFVGPIISMVIIEKLKPLDFIVYPGRYLKKEKRN
ncbi:MAG: acyltransferase [Lachnospiraceae bacterium]|nr:acyltransferase [Lachnospiraceae bacterium]